MWDLIVSVPDHIFIFLLYNTKQIRINVDKAKQSNISESNEINWQHCMTLVWTLNVKTVTNAKTVTNISTNCKMNLHVKWKKVLQKWKITPWQMRNYWHCTLMCNIVWHYICKCVTPIISHFYITVFLHIYNNFSYLMKSFYIWHNLFNIKRIFCLH